MKNKPNKSIDFKQFFTLYGIRFLISLTFSIGLFLLIYFLNISGSYLVSALNAATINFILMLAICFFSIATRSGFFDIFAYSAIRFKAHLNPHSKEDQAFYGVYDYTKSKEIKRIDSKYFYLIYLSIAIIYLILTIILYVIYRINV